ncbi:glycosyltransferase family 4 protein [Eudoraea chungangensis]|uniref:glycosyltransferase family 4 protein n=1 Tax=Eudoraea chungangensis TaxID=1481905 RepID=UPI0023EA8F69|nr:glycosyltransferase family 4 protein [Eudoraea chungangensis]
MHKVLIITYYWPPAGGPGVQRWLNFVKYLPDLGVQPLVYVPSNPTYAIRDHSLLDEVDDDVIVYKTKIFEPYKLASIFSRRQTSRISSGIITTKTPSNMEKLLLWIRGNLFIPDARKFWVKPSVRYISKLLKEENIRTIVTTGPPHSMHLIGFYLRKNTDVRWIADFRDPWTSISYHNKLRLTKRSRKKHLRLEKEVLRNCDDIIVTSETTKKEFEKISSRPIHVVTNGFENTEDSIDSPALSKKFTISHIGSMLSERNPVNLWKAIAELQEENEDFRNALDIQLIGVVGEEVVESLTDFGLKENVSILGYVSHKRAIEYQKSSQLLLLVEIDSIETSGIIPGKFFEYLAAKRPILAIGPDKWEVGEMIQQTRAGGFFKHQQKQEIKQQLNAWFNAYLAHGLHVDSANIEKYSRKSLTLKLAQELQWE